MKYEKDQKIVSQKIVALRAKVNSFLSDIATKVNDLELWSQKKKL